MSFVGKLSTQRKTCSTTTLSTSYPAWTFLESILCFHGEGPFLWRYLVYLKVSTNRINLPRERIIVPTSRTSTVLLLV